MGIKILVTGRNHEITKTVIRLINNQPGWEGVAALTNYEAMALFKQQTFNLVLIGAGLTPEEKEQLSNFCNTQKPGVPVIQHYGGGSGLLFAEIYKALGNLN